MSLRNKLVRLAYERPDLRSRILPLLQEDAEMIRTAAKATKVTFVQAVLENPAQFKAWVQAQEGVPSMTGWDFKSHHMTLEFFGGKGSASSLKPYAEFIGNSYILDVVGVAADSKCCAVLVKTRLPTKNKNPHITVAVNGVPPSYSNELLEKGMVVPCTGKIRVKVGYFDGRGGGDKFELPEDYKG